MKIVGEKSIAPFIKICLQILFVVGILLMFVLPFLGVKYYAKFLFYPFLFIFLGIIYLTGIPALIILTDFIHLFNLLKENNPFIDQTVGYLKQASICCFIIAVCYIALVGFSFWISNIHFIIFTSIVMAVFAIAWIGLYILAELFKQANQYKEENDLTI